MSVDLPLLIIGAGPYGLGLGAFAQRHGLDYLVVGKFMDSWHNNITEGLSFREVPNWHFDPVGGHSIEDYLASQNHDAAIGQPLSSQFLLDYAEWFRNGKSLNVLEQNVTQLNLSEGIFEVTLADGARLRAQNVVVALDQGQFPYLPRRLAKIFNPERIAHTSRFSDVASLKGKRCLIIGNRRSAFEWAALLHDSEVAGVHISINQSGPQIEKSDWSWINEWLDHSHLKIPTFRALSVVQKEEINNRIWLESMGKVEPCVKRRMKDHATWVWPRSRIVRCLVHPDNSLKILLDSGERLTIDFVLFATGYKADISTIASIKKSNFFGDLHIKNGCPKLDDNFQSDVPGLYFTSYAAVREFGDFFGYTMAVRASAKIIGNRLLNSIGQG